MSKKITQLTTISAIDISNDQMVIVDVSDSTQDASGTTKKVHPDDLGIALGIQTKAEIAAAPDTGTTVIFLFDRVYGSIDAPETGNITVDTVGAQLMVTVLILHQNATEPTYPANFKKQVGSADYDPTKVNRILCTFIDANTIDYSISYPA